MLAPAFGIDEDPVTGSAQGPVAAWLVTRGLLPRGAGSGPRYRYTAEQGDIIGRPGRIQVSVDLEEQPESSGIARITITGRAVTVLRGAITLET
jgi:PhzF family phenazine biosynthesis protein